MLQSDRGKEFLGKATQQVLKRGLGCIRQLLGVRGMDRVKVYFQHKNLLATYR